MVSSIGGMPSFSPQMLTQMREKMFSKLDADADGSITKVELEAAPKPEGRNGGKAPGVDRMLKDFDGDGDGAITQSEMTAGFQKIDERMQGQFLRMQEAGEQRGLGGPPPSADELFSTLDADGDGDGAISKEEMTAGFERRAKERQEESGGVQRKLQQMLSYILKLQESQQAA